MNQRRALVSGINVTIAIVLAAFTACDDGDSTADAIATSQKACSIDLDCEYEGQECATEGPHEGTCAPTLCAAPSDCLDTEMCVSSAGDDLGWCLISPQTGDPCTSAVEQTFACTDSGSTKQAFACEGGTWNTARSCPDGQPCYGSFVGRTVLACGTEDFLINYAVEGWPCEDEQSAACTFDQSALLNCQAGMWQFFEMCGASGRRCERVTNGDMGIMCANNGDDCLVCL